MKEKLIKLIKNAMLSKNKVELEVLRAIKTKFMEFETAKDAVKLTPAIEVQILNKMYKERVDTAKIYTENGRQELADKELEESLIIKEFLPKEATKEEIEKFVETLGVITQNEMGSTIKKVKENFENANGKIIADVVKSKIQK